MLRQYASLSSREHAQAAAAKRSEERRGATRDERLASVDFNPNDLGISTRRTRLHRIELWIDRVWLAHELDMVMALLLSAGMLILSIVSYQQRKSTPSSSGGLNPRADLSVYKSQLAASILFVTGSIFSILVSWRRKVTSRRDLYVGKRRTVLSFLNKLNMWEEAQEAEDGVEPPIRVDDQEAKKEAVQLSGTALTDVYSVYRLPNNPASLSGGQWHKLPSLLLVQGDFISLQVGDIAPANCTLVPMVDSRSSRGGAMGPLNLVAGERFAGTAVTFSTIPAGRSTLKPENSRELLELCNRTNIFVVTDTPLINTLSRGHGKENEIHSLFVWNFTMCLTIISSFSSSFHPLIHSSGTQTSPQICRKVHAFRRALQVLSMFTLTLTFILIFVRPTSSDLSLLLPLPLLASLGTLPVCTPVYVFFLEVFGTARILTTAHPFASRTSSTGIFDNQESTATNARSLFWRYTLNAVFSRLFKNENTRHFRSILTRCIVFLCSCGRRRKDHESALDDLDDLIKIPPASTYLLEKLGVVTALTLVDDELACEPYSTPQQLLIPSGNGLKLLDLCPNFGDEDAMELDSVDERGEYGLRSKRRSKSFGDSSHDSDSDDDESEEGEIYQHVSAPKRTLQALRQRYKKTAAALSVKKSISRSGRINKYDALLEENEVIFEDPLWWQYLPSLKCIGLACALMEYENTAEPTRSSTKNLKEKKSKSSVSIRSEGQRGDSIQSATTSLVDHISRRHEQSQLMSLANCIGFSTSENSLGKMGDLSPFSPIKHLHFVATRLLHSRLSLDRHAIGLEESRSWGRLKADATSIIIQDHRSKAYQLLSVGDARVITDCCTDAWQGENSTISPLSSADRKTVLETSKNWALSDLDVSAFSYTPVRNTMEERISGARRLKDKSTVEDSETRSYLVDNRGLNEVGVAGSSSKNWVGDWSLVKNQIFLGLLGSAVIPSKEVEPILEACTEAGVRFVYFSPRNMRRTKELASQMGIDVAWNCAISLRPLDGQADPHRMTSTYADWDVNAKLPHGVEDVKKHLEEVDNVPLLVSLFTDATKNNTAEMVGVFQTYHDTVLSIGLSHLSQNECIFSTADMAIGVDILCEDFDPESSHEPHGESESTSDGDGSGEYVSADGIIGRNYSRAAVLPDETLFVSSIVAHSCILNLRGTAAISHIPDIIASGRGALDSSSVAGLYATTGYVSYAFMVLFCPFSVTTSIPFVPALGSLLFLQFLLPSLGFSLAATDPDKQSMDRVPPKNDESIVFTRGEGRRLFRHTCIRALIPAIAAHFVHLIGFGSLMLNFERAFLYAGDCGTLSGGLDWQNVARCDAVRQYSGPVKDWAGSLMLAELALCVLVLSASFLSRTEFIKDKNPWRSNPLWGWGLFASLLLIVFYLVATLDNGVWGALPWYFYIVAIIMPPLGLLASEFVKKSDQRQEYRAEKLRRLQFETRLGMWSPKESRFLHDDHSSP